MPSHVSKKCSQCSKLSVEEAMEKHGDQGDGCWSGEACHKRRTYYKYRERYNRDRRHKYQGEKDTQTQLEGIEVPKVPVVIVYFYRTTKNEPLHALGVTLHIGKQRLGTPKLIHTLGWTEAEVRAYIKSAIAEFNSLHEITIRGVAATVELDPSQCRLEDCPLKVDLFGQEINED